MNALASAIQERFDVLAEDYDRRLQSHDAYATMSAQVRSAAVRRTLHFVVEWLQSGDDARLVQFLKTTAQERIAQGLDIQMMQYAVDVLGTVLEPLIEDVDTAKLIWRTFFKVQGQIVNEAAERQRSVEDALREAEERFRAIYEGANDAIMLLSPEGFFDCNPRTLEMFGFKTKEEFTAVHPADVSPPFQPDGQASMPAAQERIQTAYEQGYTRFDWVHRRATGQDFPAEVLLSAIDLGGQRVLQATVRDITARKRLENEVQGSLARRSIEVQTSIEVAQEIAAAPALEDLFQRVVTLIKERFGYYHAQIFSYDPTLDAVVLVSGYGEAGQKMLAAGHKLVLGRGVVGTAADTGQSILASDVAQDKDWRPNPHLPDTQGELAVPIKLRDKVLGILDVQSETAGALTVDDQLLLEGLCGQIAIVIDNVRLVEETQATLAETQALLRLSSSVISFESLSNLLQSVVDNVAELLPADRVSLKSFDLEKRAITHFIKGGPGSSHILTNVSFDELWNGLSGWALRERKPALSLKDVSDPRESLEVQQRRRETECGAIIVVPLIYRDRVLGTLTTINRPDEANFTQKNVDLLVAMANQVAAAIENARLFEETENALNEVQQSENLMRTLIDATPDWIFIKDREHRYRLANQGYANALHLRPEDFIGKDDLELGFPEELVKGNPEKGIRGFWTDDQLVLDTGEVQVYPDDPATIDGTVHTFHTIKTPLRDADGHIWGVLAFARDITASKEAERALLESEKRFRTLFEKSADATLIMDNGIFVDCNQAAVEMLHATDKAQFLFRSPEHLSPERQPDGRLSAEKAAELTQTALEQGSHHFEWVYRRLDGQYFWTEVLLTPINIGERPMIYTIWRDITERKQTEAQVQETMRELERLTRAATRTGWQGLQETGQLAPGYRFDRLQVQPDPDVWSPQVVQAVQQNTLAPATAKETVVAAPMAVRGEVIGALGVFDDPEHPLSAAELALLQEIIEQGALALESARLYQDTQRRAARERMTREITDAIQGATDMESLMRIATEELVRALGGAQGYMRLGVESPTSHSHQREGEPENAEDEKDRGT